MKALILSGGGARGAYQVGVINAVADIAKQLEIKSPFKIYTGLSAGAINSAFMAAGAEDFAYSARRLRDLWANLTSDRVFKTDAISLGKIGLRWVGELSFGGISGSTPGRSLLDTEPLTHTISNNIDFSRIQKNIDSGNVYALAVTALDYRTSEAVTFIQGQESCPQWKRNRRHSEKTLIQTGHIMASSAIPILFPPVGVGMRFFGDGCIRNAVPLSPAIHMGARDLLIVGVRNNNPPPEESQDPHPGVSPSVARVINVLLNSVLLDGVEADIDRLEKINEFLSRVPEEHRENLNFKTVNSVFISPSADIGALAHQMSSRLPRLIRYLLKGLGPMEDASEIISYLMFEKDFCSRLIEMGYNDGMNQKQEIQAFLER